jgi:hypothetical protein
VPQQGITFLLLDMIPRHRVELIVQSGEHE